MQHVFESLEPGRKFDLVLLSDTVFNHSQANVLLDTCQKALESPVALSGDHATTHENTSKPAADLCSAGHLRTPAVLCFFSHHRPKPALVEADNRFMTLAQERGFEVTKVWHDPQAGVRPQSGGSGRSC